MQHGKEYTDKNGEVVKNTLAKTMMALMIRGLFLNFTFPLWFICQLKFNWWAVNTDILWSNNEGWEVWIKSFEYYTRWQQCKQKIH